jgi:CheY-like chemotaxis protein
MAHILVIDDDAAIRAAISFTLGSAGHTVSLAADGRHALALLRARPVDLVLTDLVMPEQDGIETIMALRHVFPALPVIAMSGALPNAGLYLEIAASLGVRQTLAKPFAPDGLLRAIDQILERVRAA